MADFILCLLFSQTSYVIWPKSLLRNGRLPLPPLYIPATIPKDSDQLLSNLWVSCPTTFHFSLIYFLLIIDNFH